MAVTLDEARIAEIVERVMARLGAGPTAAPAPPAPGRMPAATGAARIPRASLGVYADPEAAVQAARRGFEANEKAPVALRAKMIAAMREVTARHLVELANYAVEESGLGRAEDKINKNRLVMEKTPGVEILRPVAFTGDDGLMLTERAPYGVILAVTPTTNPTETVLCNAIGMIAGGNAVVFNVHPSAARVCNWFVHLLNEAIQGVGGPRDVIVSVERPTIESAGALMKHPNVRLVVVTGGPARGAGGDELRQEDHRRRPGQPAGGRRRDRESGQGGRRHRARRVDRQQHHLHGGEGDHRGRLDRRRAHPPAARRKGCLLLDARQVRDLERVVLEGDSTNKKFVGKNASVIAEQIGLRGHGPDLRLLLCDVPEEHPFVQHELLMPVIGLVRVRDAAEAIAAALRVEHGFHHTAVMHSTNIDNMAAMARVCNCSIFVKNDCNLAGLGLGGEGYTSFTIASPTGEGLTTAIHFTRERRCTLKEAFRFV